MAALRRHLVDSGPVWRSSYETRSRSHAGSPSDVKATRSFLISTQTGGNAESTLTTAVQKISRQKTLRQEVRIFEPHGTEGIVPGILKDAACELLKRLLPCESSQPSGPQTESASLNTSTMTPTPTPTSVSTSPASTYTSPPSSPTKLSTKEVSSTSMFLSSPIAPVTLATTVTSDPVGSFGTETVVKSVTDIHGSVSLATVVTTISVPYTMVHTNIVSTTVSTDVLTVASSSTNVETSGSTSTSTSADGTSKGTIVGAAVGISLGCILLIFIGFWLLWKRRPKETPILWEACNDVPASAASAVPPPYNPRSPERESSWTEGGSPSKSALPEYGYTSQMSQARKYYDLDNDRHRDTRQESRSDLEYADDNAFQVNLMGSSHPQ